MESLDYYSTNELYQRRLTNKLLNENKTDGNVNEYWERIKARIHKAAEESLGKRKINVHAQNHNTPWFSLNRTIILLQQHKDARNRANAEKRRIKREYCKKSTTIYNTIYMEHKGNQVTNMRAEQAEEEVPISFTEEVKKKKLKNRKALGVDNTPNELLKYGSNKLNKKTNATLQWNIQLTNNPDDWHKSFTIPFFKKEQKTNPKNYRDNLEQDIEIKDEQLGFRINRSTTDALFIIRQIKEKAIEFDTPAFACFIDLTKAFEEKTNDIRQGDSLSPFLFTLIIDEIIAEISGLIMGYRIHGKLISIICYTNGATILAETEDNLQRQLHRFNQVSTQFNMQISISKTKCMTFAREPTRCKPVINNEIVGQVTTFRYLGADISSRNEPTKDFKSQINKASLTSGCLRDGIWNNKHISIDSKVRIYKTCGRPILTHGIETRAHTNKTKCMLRTTEMKTLSSIAGKALRDIVRSATIRQTCKVEDVIRWGRKRRRCWRDHVERMHPERIAKIVAHLPKSSW
ncbi:hypothetical protein HUJ05_008764 [Dendroctonus ponderosae]|nr:hypothetical protein HUJ05_008764 [Dendroctonus ponderosae]